MPAAHLFVADVDGPVVDEEDRHHIERVLRLRPGEEVTVSDGAGGVRRCVLDRRLELEPVGAVERQTRPAPPIGIGFALVKGDRPEWITQKLTELGVDRIVPFTAARSVVRWEGDKAARQHERLAKIAREAAMQSRRVWLPVVDAPTTFTDVVAQAGDRDVAPTLAAFGGGPPSLRWPFVLVGPEGGWTDDELGAVPRHVDLGPTVLRTETAALAAGALLAALRADLVRKVDQ